MKRTLQMLIETGSSSRRACCTSKPTGQLLVRWKITFRTFLSLKSFVYSGLLDQKATEIAR